MCDELSNMDLKSLASDDLIKPRRVISDARCFTSKKRFAVSAIAAEEHYCIAATSENILSNDVQPGKIASKNSVSWKNAASSPSSSTK